MMILVLAVLPAIQAVIWSAQFDQSMGRMLLNGFFEAFVVALTLWLHRRWKLKPVLSRVEWLILLNLSLLAVSLVHGYWLNEDNNKAWGTGISDGLYALDGLLNAQAGLEPWVTQYLTGHVVWLAGVVGIFGLENFYAIALVNTLFLCLAALAVAAIVREWPGGRPSAVIWMFLLHPYSVVLAATIYKDPMVVSGTIFVFLGMGLELRRRRHDMLLPYPSAALMVAAGLLLTVTLRLAYALALVAFVVIVFVVQAVRDGRIGRRFARFSAVTTLAIVAILLITYRVGMLGPTIEAATRRFNVVPKPMVATGGYVADASSLATRYMSGPLINRLHTVPLQIAMQLASPFPPTFRPITHVYIWVEEWFGAINISLSPFIALGLLAAWRSRSAALRLIPLYCLFIIAPAVAFSGVVGRQLFPIVPFLLLLAWLGWRALAPGTTRTLVALSVPAFWLVAFTAYGWLRG